jgi:nucleotide-binding universal stress UspA family protein
VVTLPSVSERDRITGADQPVEFRAVLCGVDGSAQSLVAARQALALGTDDAKYWALTAWDPGLAVHAGLRAFEVMDELRDQARSALRRARELSPAITPMMIRGRDVAALLGGIANLEADLVAVGTHGHSRAAGVLFGSVASAAAHFAPCSVLIAREPSDGAFPGLILHANDGSHESLDAADVAGRLAARHGSEVVTVHVGETHDPGVVEQAVGLIDSAGVEPTTRVEPGSPHRRLVEVAHDVGASLIVIGSRGRTGVAALGSVSERVAHRASCSVLIVRRPAHPVREAAVLEGS